MATKAELFRYRQERSGPKKKKRAPRRKRSVSKVDTALPGKSATDRRVGGGKFLNKRNRSKKAIRTNRVRGRSRARPKSGR